MDIAHFTSQITILGMLGLSMTAALTDLRDFRVPNTIPLAIALLYPIFLIIPGVEADALGSLITGAIALLAGFTLFSLRLCGGGDAKLFAALALWAGPSLILPFAIWTALAGGLLSIAMWFRHRAQRAATLSTLRYANVSADFHRQPMPYAVAIAVGALYLALALLRGL